MEKLKEIKKALECCGDIKEKCDNKKCYLFDKLEYHYCERQLKTDILTLINELECENEKLTNTVLDSLDAYRDGFSAGARLKDRVDNKLKTENNQLKDRIAELEEYIKGNEADAKAFVNGWHKDLETELKQFAERLKKKAIRRQEFIGELAIDDIEYVKTKDIDETLKEFLCEKYQ